MGYASYKPADTVVSLLVGWLVGQSVGLGPKILDNGSQPSLNESP